MNKNKNAYSPREKFSSSAILWAVFAIGLTIGCGFGIIMLKLLGG